VESSSSLIDSLIIYSAFFFFFKKNFSSSKNNSVKGMKPSKLSTPNPKKQRTVHIKLINSLTLEFRSPFVPLKNPHCSRLLKTSKNSNQNFLFTNVRPDTLCSAHNFSYSDRKLLVQALQQNRSLVVVGETGSGKTTQIPQFLHEEKMDLNGMIGNNLIGRNFCK